MSKLMPKGYGIVQKSVMKSSLSMNAKCLYATLASLTGADEYCFPKQSTLSEWLGCSESTIKRLFKELVDFGVIRKEKLNKKSFVKQNKYYVLLHDDLSNSSLVTPSEGLPVEPSNSTLVTPSNTNKHYTDKHITNIEPEQSDSLFDSDEKEQVKDYELIDDINENYEKANWKQIIDIYKNTYEELTKIKLDNKLLNASFFSPLKSYCKKITHLSELIYTMNNLYKYNKGSYGNEVLLPKYLNSHKATPYIYTVENQKLLESKRPEIFKVIKEYEGLTGKSAGWVYLEALIIYNLIINHGYDNVLYHANNLRAEYYKKRFTNIKLMTFVEELRGKV